ncbi:MAG: outer membrane protein assembly factor BamB family protein [Pirellulales bacterium]
MLSPEEFLALLEQRDLLPAERVAELRRQIAKSPKPVSAASLASLLVTQGYLTKMQADRFLAWVNQPPEPFLTLPDDVEEELGLAPLENEEPPGAADDLPTLDAADDLPGPGAMGGLPTLGPVGDSANLGLVAPGAMGGLPSPGAMGGLPTLGPAARQESRVAKTGSAGASPSQKLPSQATPSPAWSAPVAPPPVDPRAFMAQELAAGVAASAAGQGALDASWSAGTALGDPLAKNASKPKGWRRIFSRARKRGSENEWDSPLLLIGGAALSLLVLIGIGVIWAMTRQSGDTMLEQAEEQYRAGSYTQAIHKYDLYLEKFPNHYRVSFARVRRGLCQMRQATEGTRNWGRALTVVKQAADEIAPEPEFAQARADLAAMLPAIAEGLAAEARGKPDAALVAQAREALDLVDKYVPKSLRPATRLADVEASLALTTRTLARDRELAKSVVAMRQAAKEGKTQAAYTLRKTLLKQYPELADDKALRDAESSVSRAERAAVKLVRRSQAAETSEVPQQVLSATALVERVATADVPGVEGRVVCAQVAGAVYGLEATGGKVLWRRAIGEASNARSVGFPPTSVSEEAGSDLLLVDPARDEVLRVEAVTGRLRWRFAVQEPFDAYPLVLDERLLVATRSGRLVFVDLGSGKSSSYLQLPEPLRVAPVVDPQSARLYQIADHSNLFVLAADGTCLEVVYLGHRAGSITAAPVIFDRFLVIAENAGLDQSVLRVLSLGTKTSGVKPVAELRVEGHVDIPPQVAGRRMLVTTDQGAACVYELAGASEKTPFRKVAENPAHGKVDLVRFAFLRQTDFWVADDQLARYEIQASRSRLVDKWIVHQDSVFLQPPMVVGPTLFLVRNKTGLSGAAVSAVDAEGGRQRWETRLAVPLAGEPQADAAGGKLTAITATGGLFVLDAASLAVKSLQDQPAAVIPPAELGRSLASAIVLGDGLIVASAASGTDHLARCDSGSPRPEWRRIALTDKLACRPAAMAGGLAVPGLSGRVFLIDPRSGANLCEPFQPRLEPGVQLAWREPAPAGPKEIVVSDGRTKLYRLGVKDQPRPHLAAFAEVELPQAIVTPVAIAGQAVYAADGGGVLYVFKLPELLQGQPRTLGSPCVWGPRGVGNCVLLATADERLFCLGADGKLVWQVPLAGGPLAGTPCAVGGNYLLASTRGVVWRVDGKTGKLLAKVDTGRPLGTGPVLMGDRLVVGGRDGTLYEIKQP